MRQLVYTMFISNNHKSFHFWWEENLVKHQKVTKYYKNDCLKKFLSLFMSISTAQVVKNVSVKRSEKQLPRKGKFRTFLQLNCSNFSLKLVKSLIVTKIVREIKFQEVWGELEAKKCFQKQSFTKYLRLTLVFMWNSALREKFNFCCIMCIKCIMHNV